MNKLQLTEKIYKEVKTKTMKDSKRILINKIQNISNYSFEKAYNLSKDITLKELEKAAKRTNKNILIKVLAQLQTI